MPILPASADLRKRKPDGPSPARKRVCPGEPRWDLWQGRPDARPKPGQAFPTVAQIARALAARPVYGVLERRKALALAEVGPRAPKPHV